MLKGAIIGFGKIALTAHLPAYNNPVLKDKIIISAVVEPSEPARLNGKKKFPEINFYRNTEEMLSNEKIDFVDISCPPAYHYDILKKFIEQDVHIICEKPFTLTSEQAEDIYECLMKLDKVFIPCHQYKYSPVWKNFKGYIDNNVNRSKILMQFDVFRTEADRGIEKTPDSWRTKNTSLGGGILADTGIHYLYLSLWLVGSIEKVTVRLPVLYHNYNAEDTALITLESAKAIIQVNLTWGADRRFNSARAVSAYESIFYENGNTIIKNSPEGTEKIQVPDSSDKSNYISLYIELFKDFLTAVENNKPDESWMEEAYKSIKLMNSCYLSSEMGKTIRLI